MLSRVKTSNKSLKCIKFVKSRSQTSNAGYAGLNRQFENNGSQPSGSGIALLPEQNPRPTAPTNGYSKFTQYSTLAVLFCINLLNYMDRYTIISVVPAVRQAFEINNKQTSLLNMVFLISYMILSPVVGYLG